MRPNNLPPEIILEKQRRDLGFDKVVLTIAKFKRKSITAFSRKLQVKFQGVKMHHKQICFLCYCKLCPQGLTKWYSGLKLILEHIITSSENLGETALFPFQKHWLEYQLV